MCKDTVRIFGHDLSLGELVAYFSECQTLPSVLCRAVLFPFLCTACCMVRSCQSCGCVPSFSPSTPDWVTPTADADIIKCSADVPGFCPLMASVFGGRTLSKVLQSSVCVTQGGGSVVQIALYWPLSNEHHIEQWWTLADTLSWPPAKELKMLFGWL